MVLGPQPPGRRGGIGRRPRAGAHHQGTGDPDGRQGGHSGEYHCPVSSCRSEGALHEVEGYEERLYSDVQLAARRSLASMKLEEILTNRNRLSEDILHDVKETAARYGVSILRADVKDLVFPGNLQEIMNKVLAAERLSEAQLVEARTKAQTQQIEAQAKAEIRRVEAEAQAEALRLQAQVDAESQKIRTD